MRFSQSITTSATAQKIFDMYADVAQWSKWDKDVEYSSIDGDFKTGATGVLKPKGAPKSTLYFTEIKKNKSFTTMSKLPLCLIYFEHTITVIDETSVEITHSVEFVGALSFFFGRVIGNSIKKNLPEVLHTLKLSAETT